MVDALEFDVTAANSDTDSLEGPSRIEAEESHGLQANEAAGGWLRL